MPDVAPHLDAWLLLQVLVFSAAVPLIMRLGLARVQRTLTLREPRRTPRNLESIARHVDVCRRVGWPLVRRGCLTRGVALCYFCRREGIDVRLAFGMTRTGDRFTGHCWLTRNDEPLLEREDPRPIYTHIITIPGARESHGVSARKLVRLSS